MHALFQIMACVNKCKTEHFRRHLLVFFLITFSSVFYLNYKFNMSEHYLTPSFLSAIFHRNSSIYKTGYSPVKKTNNNHTLVNLPKITAKSSTSSNKRANPNLRHSILWYNKPSWIDLYFGNADLTSKCAYSNCEMTTKKGNIQSHSAIVFTFTEVFPLSPPLPPSQRSPDQAWIFFGIESPVNLWRWYHRHTSWKNTMNWSMTYRLDADIYHPYGLLESRTTVPVRNYSQIYHRKTRFAAWFVSNCGVVSGRDEYVADMKKHGIPVDIFGNCANKPKYHDKKYLQSLINNEYKFYLSFENSLCKDYITEKFFRQYNLDVVLVTRGGSNYSALLPNGVYIDTASFASVRDLARYLLRVNASEQEYTGYLRRKDKYEAREMFSVSHSYCSICEKVNNLDENRKMYDDMVAYLHGDDGLCVAPSDVVVYHYWKWLISAAVVILVLVILRLVFMPRRFISCNSWYTRS